MINMNKITHRYYTAGGYVLGHFWGGGMGWYPMVKYHADTIEELKLLVEQGVETGSADSGMGYESLIGACYIVHDEQVTKLKGKAFVCDEAIEVAQTDKITEEQFDFWNSEL